MSRRASRKGRSKQQPGRTAAAPEPALAAKPAPRPGPRQKRLLAAALLLELVWLAILIVMAVAR